MSAATVITSKLNWDFAKRLAGEKAVTRVLNYLEGNPEINLPRLFKIMEGLARIPLHREMVAGIRIAYEQNPAIRSYFNRILREIDRDVRNRLFCNFIVSSLLLSLSRRKQVREQEGINVPYTILIDPTSACNLRCTGCWAGAYARRDELEPELLDRILQEAKELGIYTIVMSGGEPFIYPYLLDMAAKHDDMAFMVYTNGTLIDQAVADRLRELGNLAPAFSLEGGEAATDARRGRGVYKKILAAMGRLRERGVVFGASVTITRNNFEEITGDNFIDFLIDQGARFMWIFHYVPIGRQPDVSLMILPEQRAYLAQRIPHLRRHKPLPIADFWNDGELTHGCIAGGNIYFHIAASGDVEPCAFVHFAVDNIRQKSLRDVLGSPFFVDYQRRQPFSENLLRPCPLIDNPGALREIVKAAGAHPTHDGAESVLGGEIGSFLDQRSAEWEQMAAQIWTERQQRKTPSRACL